MNFFFFLQETHLSLADKKKQMDELEGPMYFLAW